jgi:hypothetical protein
MKTRMLSLRSAVALGLLLFLVPPGRAEETRVFSPEQMRFSDLVGDAARNAVEKVREASDVGTVNNPDKKPAEKPLVKKPPVKKHVKKRPVKEPPLLHPLGPCGVPGCPCGKVGRPKNPPYVPPRPRYPKFPKDCDGDGFPDENQEGGCGGNGGSSGFVGGRDARPAVGNRQSNKNKSTVQKGRKSTRGSASGGFVPQPTRRTRDNPRPWNPPRSWKVPTSNPGKWNSRSGWGAGQG